MHDYFIELYLDGDSIFSVYSLVLDTILVFNQY